jgi:hypothetical protein
VQKLMVVLVGILMLANAATALADTKVTVGVKAWANKWDYKNEFTNGTSKTWDNGDSLMVGPSLNLRFGDHFFVGATYLKSTKDYESGDWAFTGAKDKMAFKRTDLDLTMGVMFSRYFGLFAGYKTVDAPATYTSVAGVTTDNGKWTLKGPGFGVVASIPLGSSAALYGNLAFMSLTNEWNTTKVDETGASVELGGAVAFTPSFSGTLGYKVQSFSGDYSSGTTHTDTFSGVTLGLNYTF